MVAITEPLRTDRLILRPFEAGDLDDVHAYQSLPEVVEFMLWELRSREESGEHLARRESMTRLEKDGDVLVLAVVLPHEPRVAHSASADGDAPAESAAQLSNDSGRVIGELTIFLRSTLNKHAELGWAFHPDFQGAGYATEAARLMRDFAFTELDAHRVTAELDPQNDRSAALARRLGMRQEAHFREDFFTKGSFGDTAVFAILRSEWAAARA